MTKTKIAKTCKKLSESNINKLIQNIDKLNRHIKNLIKMTKTLKNW